MPKRLLTFANTSSPLLLVCLQPVFEREKNAKQCGYTLALRKQTGTAD